LDFIDVSEAEAEAVSAMVRESFGTSEGPEEGALIAGLAARLLTETPEGDVHGFAARRDGAFVGAIIFSRMRYADDPRSVFVLAPVAVASAAQGQGVGTGLIRHGLAAIGARGVDVALTYGDPAYYGRFGFQPITTEEAAAPFPLAYPHGWLGQSLGGGALAPLKGVATCVAALNDPAFW
jgi:putative acetyltransferase